MSPKPEDRPSAEKVLASSLLAGRRAGSPKAAAAQPLVHQNSTASTQSATTVDGATVAAGIDKAGTASHAAGGSSKQFGGLVLQRSTLK